MTEKIIISILSQSKLNVLFIFLASETIVWLLEYQQKKNNMTDW